MSKNFLRKHCKTFHRSNARRRWHRPHNRYGPIRKILIQGWHNVSSAECDCDENKTWNMKSRFIIPAAFCFFAFTSCAVHVAERPADIMYTRPLPPGEGYVWGGGGWVFVSGGYFLCG